MIPQKYVWLRRLVALRDEVRTVSPDAAVIVQRMIAKTMPSLHYNVYTWIAGCRSETNSHDIEWHWNIKQTHACTILLELYQLGLLERTAVKTPVGQHYEYRVK